jgi:hypothetical protein
MRILRVLFRRDKSLATQQVPARAITTPLLLLLRFHGQPQRQRNRLNHWGQEFATQPTLSEATAALLEAS